MDLREYQREGINMIRSSMQSGHRVVCAVGPTSMGKTRTGAEMARMVLEKGGKVLWLAHRTELIDQAIDTLKEAGLGVGSVCATSRHQPNAFAPVQVGSVQTLLARKIRPDANLIVADEFHHFVAKSFAHLMAAYPTTHAVGFTATPERGDGRGLGEMADDLVVIARPRELVAAGWLTPCHLIRPGYKLKRGAIAQSPYDAWAENALGRSTLVFSPSVELAEKHAKEFRDHGVSAVCVHEKTPWTERKKVLAEYSAGRIKVLTNVYILTEGTDLPITSCVIVARTCGTRGMFIQMGGRGGRLFEGKSDYILADLHGESWVLGHPEDDMDYSLQGRGIRKQGEPDSNHYCRVCGCPVEPGEPCPDCGAEPRVITQTVTGDKLEPYSGKRKESESKRVATLARWVAEGIAKDYKPGWAKNKFHIVYGTWPTSAQMNAAYQQLKEEEA